MGEEERIVRWKGAAAAVAGGAVKELAKRDEPLEM